MERYQELPIAIQTIYADLVHRAWTSNIVALTSRGGSAYSREVKGRLYWYWQPPTAADGKRPSAKYIGPDSEETRLRLQEMRGEVENLRQRRDMVRALRAARLPVPDAMSGDVMAAMAEAGVFRLRATVVGSVAFQAYPGMLGVHVPAGLSRIGDPDIGQLRSIAIAVEDEIAPDLESVLKSVDRRFEPIPSPSDTRKTLRYALRVGGDERFSVDVLSPLRGSDRNRAGNLTALRSGAQFLRYLDFLLYQEVNAIVLHGAGIPINVPDPTRYALHKLIVSQVRRMEDPRSAAKSRKDLEHARALIAALSVQRAEELKDLWRELCGRGPSWREKALAAVRQLPAEIAQALGEETASGRGQSDSWEQPT